MREAGSSCIYARGGGPSIGGGRLAEMHDDGKWLLRASWRPTPSGNQLFVWSSVFNNSIMPPRIQAPLYVLSIPFRPRPPVVRWKNTNVSSTVQPLSRGLSSSKDLPVSEDKKGPNTDQLPHISEEAAATAKAKGETPPDLEQGTPVQEVSFEP